MSGIIARRCYVSGRVQGVFYRASARQQALALGVRGYAHNLADGRVEVLAIGEPSAVHALLDWLRQGPPGAQVKHVETLELRAAPDAAPSGFTTG